MSLTYFPAIFDVSNLEQARAIILTSEGGATTEERWRSETPYLSAMIDALIRPGPDSLILDYGCDVGRLEGEDRAQRMPRDRRGYQRQHARAGRLLCGVRSLHRLCA